MDTGASSVSTQISTVSPLYGTYSNSMDPGFTVENVAFDQHCLLIECSYYQLNIMEKNPIIKHNLEKGLVQLKNTGYSIRFKQVQQRTVY